MLKVDNIDVYYGAIHAIKGISIEVPKGEIVTLVGSNGAGKSTTLRTISGLMKPKNGTILFEDKNIVGVPAHKIVGMGLCQVPEGRHVFANMSVMENLELGAYLRNDKDGIARDLEDVFKKFPRLLERKDQISGTLSGGEQQRVAHRDQFTVFLRGHDARDLRDRQHIALADGALFDLVHRRFCHADRRGGARHAIGLHLFAHVHHAGAALFVKMRQFHPQPPIANMPRCVSVTPVSSMWWRSGFIRMPRRMACSNSSPDKPRSVISASELSLIHI